MDAQIRKSYSLYTIALVEHSSNVTASNCQSRDSVEGERLALVLMICPMKRLKAAPTLKTPFKFLIDFERGAQSMAGVQFSRPSDHSKLKKTAWKTRPDEWSFPLREVF